MSVKMRINALERLAGTRHGGESVTVCDDGDLQRALSLLAAGVNVVALTTAADVARRLEDAGARIVLHFSGNVTPCQL